MTCLSANDMSVAGALDVALNGAYPQGWLAASVAPIAAASRGGVAKIGLLDPCGSVGTWANRGSPCAGVVVCPKRGTDAIRSPGRLDASPPATLVEPAVAPASPSSGSHDVGTTGGGHEGGIPFWSGPVCRHELPEAMPGSQSTAPRNQCESAEIAAVQSLEWQR